MDAKEEVIPSKGVCGGREGGGGGGLGFSARGGGDAAAAAKRCCVSACATMDWRSAVRSVTKPRTFRLRASVSSVSSR